MKRIIRNLEQHEVIDLFGALARKHDLRLDDPAANTRFLEIIKEGLASGRDNPIALHGRRIEGMFEHVVAGLGRAEAIKKEDAGELCFTGDKIQPPDFRLILDDGREMFVEVKNCHRHNPGYRFTLGKAYLSELRRYAALFRRDLYIAVFWSRWRIWTLNTVEDFAPEDDWSITFLKAVHRNRMALLGDVLVGTTPPLTLRLYADPANPRTIAADGQCAFTIGHVEVLCAGNPIEEENEKSLAFYFMLNSNWPTGEGESCVDNGQLIYVEYVASPEESTPDQGFDMLGSLSSMISRSYNGVTAATGVIQSLSPAMDPGALAVVIPRDYQGTRLPVWRLHVEPPPAYDGGGLAYAANPE